MNDDLAPVVEGVAMEALDLVELLLAVVDHVDVPPVRLDALRSHALRLRNTLRACQLCSEGATT